MKTTLDLWVSLFLYFFLVNTAFAAPFHSCDPASSCGCAKRRNIVNGEHANGNEWPWVVALLKNGGSHCTGTILNRWHILTAAHCSDNLPSFSSLSICAGSHDISNGCAYTRYVDTIWDHPNYDKSTYVYDISIIRLTQPLPDILPVCLPKTESSSYPSSGTETLALGFGRTGTNLPTSKVLQQVNLNVLDTSNRLCRNSNPSFSAIICASAPNKGVCSGDSGGPLLYFNDDQHRWEVVGVTSYGSRQCADNRVHDGFSRVSHVLPWIQRRLAANVTATTTTTTTTKAPSRPVYTCDCQCPRGTDSGKAYTYGSTAKDCYNACIAVASNPCTRSNTYACTQSSNSRTCSFENRCTVSACKEKIDGYISREWAYNSKTEWPSECFCYSNAEYPNYPSEFGGQYWSSSSHSISIRGGSSQHIRISNGAGSQGGFQSQIHIQGG